MYDVHSCVERGKKPLEVEYTDPLNLIDGAAIHNVPLLNDACVEYLLRPAIVAPLNVCLIIIQKPQHTPSIGSEQVCKEPRLLGETGAVRPEQSMPDLDYN